MSGEAFISPSWYRIAALRPRVKAQARIRRHRFRGQVWYVVQDPASGRFNRFSPAAYQLLGLIDGQRTMDEVWNLAVEQLGDDVPSQEEVIRLLSQLHAADLLQAEVNPDSAELLERYERQSRARSMSNLRNPFSIRFPLWDSDSFLSRTMPLLRPLFGWFGAAVYCVVVGFGVALVLLHWPGLTNNLSDRLLGAQNLLLLWICFPAVKLLHELGHGYATKAEGGEVHEMGILLLVFMPIPYVDATAATGFRSKWRRVLVGAAGMMVELFIASLAIFVWVAAEPGLLRAIAFNVVLIAGVSTLVFNANPLLRYDGYYILSDLIEVPNLASRGNQYWRYIAERYLFRMRQAEPPLMSPGERGWLLAYTPAALIYRTLILVAIVLYIASEWFFIGVLLAIWGVVAMFLTPLVKLAGYMLRLPRLNATRRRALTLSGAVIVLLTGFIGLVPVPHRILTEGVVWLPEEAGVRAGANGFVRRVLVAPGSAVEIDTPLVESHDPVLAAQLRVSEARVDELETKLEVELFRDRMKAELTRQELARELAIHDRLLERVEHLVARSAVKGRFVVAQPEDLPGRFFRKGELLGYATRQGARRIVRAVVSQDDVDLVRSRVLRVDVRLAERMDGIYPATLVREVPAAGAQLPSAALSSEGGGALAADPRDPMGNRTLASTFQFDLELQQQAEGSTYGGRAYVRFVLEPEPLAQQWSRRIRQAFLARFNV